MDIGENFGRIAAAKGAILILVLLALIGWLVNSQRGNSLYREFEV